MEKICKVRNIYIISGVCIILFGAAQKNTYLIAYGITLLLWNFHGKIRSKIAVHILQVLFISYSIFCMVEWSTNSAFSSLEWAYGIYNVIMIFSSATVLCFFFHNKIVLYTYGTAAFLMSAAANYCIRLRGLPFMVSQVKAVRTAVNVLSSYSMVPDKKLIFTIIIFLLLIYSVHRAECYRRNRKSIVCGVGLLTLLCGFCYSFYWEGNLYAYGFRGLSYNLTDSFARNGYIHCTMCDIISQKIYNPSGKGEKILDELLEESTENKINQNYPNIVLIVNESFFDIRKVKNLKTNIEITPFIDSMDNIIRGYAVNPNITTANSEYEILTGNSMGATPGCMPFISFDLSSANSIVKDMNELGYKTFGFHTESGVNYNRKTVYPALGFQNVSFLSEEYSTEELEYVRCYVSDKTCYDYIEKILQSEKENKFIYCLTVQNHGGYEIGGIQYTVKNHDGKEEENTQLSEFLTCMNLSDQAFEQFINFLKEFEEPTVVCMVGDHQPSFVQDIQESTGSEVEDYLSLNGTPFLIWANYGLENKEIGYFSMNYASSILKTECGLPLTLYDKFKIELMEKVPVLNMSGYYDKKYEWHSFTSDKLDEQVEEYRYLEYANLKGIKKGKYVFSYNNGEQ